VEIRVEAFNLLNNINWGNPAANYDQAVFGQIQFDGREPADHAVRGKVRLLTDTGTEEDTDIGSDSGTDICI
jgi:hypothetical protein